MTQLDESISESGNSVEKEDQKRVRKQGSKALEFKAGMAAITTAVLGIGLVVILQEVLCIKDTATTVTLLIVPVLVYGVVSGRISEFRAPGGWIAKFRQRLDELSDKVTATEGAVGHAIQQTTVPPPSEIEAQEDARAEGELKKVANQYKDVREKEDVGWERTINMTSIVRRMVDLAPRVAQSVIRRYLDSEDRGERLAAYACLYAKPNDQIFKKLLDSVSTTILDYEAFAQYWGLQAISRNLPEEGPSDEDKERLRSFAQRLRRGTDRDYLLRTILSQIKS